MTTSITWEHWLGRRTRSGMCQPTTLGAEADIYKSFLGLLSVLFRMTQLFQALLFKLVLLKFPTNIQIKPNPFSNMFQNYVKPNHKSPDKNLQPKLSLNLKISKQFLSIFLEISKISRKSAKFLRGKFIKG